LLGKRIGSKSEGIGQSKIPESWPFFDGVASGHFKQAGVWLLAGDMGDFQGSIAGAGILIAVGFLYRPLLFASLDEDVAEAKGMPMLFLGTSFMLVVAVAVSFAVQVTGVLLIFSLMVTPAATAQYLSRRPGTAIALSVGIALMATWAGLFVGFYTIYPVSFFITAIAFSLYILVRLARYGIRPKMATQVSKRK